MSKAQDNVREDPQKELFGLKGEHRRDQSHDASYKMPIELKTKHASKGCTTKRRYRKDPFSDKVLVVSNYKDKRTLSDDHWIIFPPALKEWREEQERKLNFDNGTLACYNDIEIIRESLSENADCGEILKKFENQIHRNDPAIPKRFFDTNGEYTSINRKKVKTKHPEYMFKVPKDVDKAKFLREKINWYLSNKEA